MAKKVSKPGKKVADYKSKPVLIYIDEQLYEGMRAYCYEHRLKHTGFIRNLIFEKLKSESYLSREAKG